VCDRRGEVISSLSPLDLRAYFMRKTKDADELKNWQGNHLDTRSTPDT
jgi:hypothetical protein